MSAPPPSALHCAGVGKSFGAGRQAAPVLSGVDLDVADGEFVALLGPSGCGKSTLLMMAAGLEPVSAGAIHALGAPVRAPVRDAGILFQDPTLLPWRTALDNVLFPLAVSRRVQDADRERAEALLRLVGLSRFLHSKPRQRSGGMRQRVALCRALVGEPRILLMDEPFSALDAITRDEMNELLLDLWERYKTTVLFVTHSIREAALLADRILVLGGRPASIIDEIRVPFARPRAFALSETPAFNALCAQVHAQIRRARRHDAIAS